MAADGVHRTSPTDEHDEAAAARTDDSSHLLSSSCSPSRKRKTSGRGVAAAAVALSVAAALVGTATLLGGSSSSRTLRHNPSHPGSRELMQSLDGATGEMAETGSTTAETDAEKASKVKGTLSVIRQEKEFLREQIALAGGGVDGGAHGGGGETPVGPSGGIGGNGGGEHEIRPPTAATTVAQQKQEGAAAPTVVQYGLAKGQSFGFFNDVPDDSWERLRDRALNQPSHANPDAPNPLADADRPNRWYQNNWDPNFTCANERRVGGSTAPDGPKWVCNPHRIGPYARERVAGGGPGCLVYSFGRTGGYYGFEEALLNVTFGGDDGPGCEVHVFDEDPPRDEDGNVPDAPPGVVVHPWGLKANDDDESKSSDPKYKSLRETVEVLGHRHRVVDVFKIDCEGCEWATYNDWFTSGLDIRQLLVETHAVPENANDFFERLRSEGYVTFHKEPNTWSAGGACQEYAFLKLDQGFFRRH